MTASIEWVKMFKWVSNYLGKQRKQIDQNEWRKIKSGKYGIIKNRLETETARGLKNHFGKKGPATVPWVDYFDTMLDEKTGEGGTFSDYFDEIADEELPDEKIIEEIIDVGTQRIRDEVDLVDFREEEFVEDIRGIPIDVLVKIQEKHPDINLAELSISPGKEFWYNIKNEFVIPKYIYYKGKRITWFLQ